MRPKLEERSKARSLRKSGLSMRQIANELGVSISSVSLWVRQCESRAPQVSPSPEAPEPLSGELKICGNCGRNLPVEDFNRHAQTGRQHWCRECFSAYFKTRGDTHRGQSAAALSRRKVAARSFIEDYLAVHPCTDCGERDTLVLEFDHTTEKRANVSVLVCAGWSLKRLEEEIRRCEVVCVNCHRRRTVRRGSSWRTDPSALDTNPRLLSGERRNMQLIRDTLRGSACVDCGLRDILVLEFDHIGQKHASVPAMARRGCSLKSLEREIAKCEIRCGNCHRRRTLGMRDLDG